MVVATNAAIHKMMTVDLVVSLLINNIYNGKHAGVIICYLHCQGARCHSYRCLTDSNGIAKPAVDVRGNGDGALASRLYIRQHAGREFQRYSPKNAFACFETSDMVLNNIVRCIG